MVSRLHKIDVPTLVNAKPPVSDDVVYVHAAVEGEQNGRLFREEFVEAYYPQEICGKAQRAISWTTAASICAIIEMVKEGTLPNNGFMRKQTAVCLVYVVTGYFFILLIAKDTMKIRMTAPTNAGTM